MRETSERSCELEFEGEMEYSGKMRKQGTKANQPAIVLPLSYCKMPLSSNWFFLLIKLQGV